MNFSALEAIARCNPALRPRFRFCDLTINLAAGETTSSLRIEDGAVIVTVGAAGDADFTLSAAPSDWEDFASERPPVGSQTLFGMATAGRLALSGPRMIEFMRYQMGLEMLLQGLRSAPAATPSPVPDTPQIEPGVGRYVRMAIGGVAHRIYFEEAGEGIPLLCLHTAGSDGRQYRALFNDPEITSRFRVIAFDLPAHGKSSPPEGFQNAVHVLTTDSYVETIMAFRQAMGLDRPVVMGCSIGGRVVLHLALRHGAQFDPRREQRLPRTGRCQSVGSPRHQCARPRRRQCLVADGAEHAAEGPLGNALVLHAGRARRLRR